MTNAAELFYNRRSRRSTADIGLNCPPTDQYSRGEGNQNRRHHSRHRRHDLDACDPLRRSSDLRHILHRASQLEREPVRVDLGSSQHSLGNNVNTQTLSSITYRTGVPRNERLPGAVLLARERLLQRLRGVSISESRQSRINSFPMPANVVNWDAEILMGLLGRGDPSTDLIPQMGQPTFSENLSKPPGLTQEALDSLHLEVFSSVGTSVEGAAAATSRASWDCSICLESFEDGDKLICLPCGHRFHSTCLDPWVRTCGDCPYCRRGIWL